MATKPVVTEIVKANIARESKFYTDESGLYCGLSAHFAEHSTVKHSVGEYVRGDVHSNTIEGYFSIFKRGLKGSISTAARSTCTATWLSSISATTTA